MKKLHPDAAVMLDEIIDEISELGEVTIDAVECFRGCFDKYDCLSNERPYSEIDSYSDEDSYYDGDWNWEEEMCSE